MRFDTIIIGGGLAGLTAGVRLASKGQKCAIISSGQSALHFFSGSFDLLGYIGDEEVNNPIEAICRLDVNHPYSKLGREVVEKTADEVVDFFKAMGVKFNGDSKKNHYRISPTGEFRKTWLTLDNHLACSDVGEMSLGKTLVLNIDGFLDFHPYFISDGLKRLGYDVETATVTIPELQQLRTSPTEMRSANIAKTLQNDKTMAIFVDEVSKKTKGYDTLILPSVFGLYDDLMEKYLVDKLDCKVYLVSTFPPSAPGIRLQMILRKHFQNLGGVYFLGDVVTNGHIQEGKLLDVHTANHKDIQFEADNFIIASGSFFSHGLQAHPNFICEPIFNLDVSESGNRQNWFNQNVFENQAYMSFGARTDKDFHPMISGSPINNLYAIGSILESANCLKESSGAGVSIITALHVANQIISK